jgi:hypothetical protein
MLTTGAGLTVTLIDAEPVHPLELVTTTEYVPDAFTEIFCVVAPFDHK